MLSMISSALLLIQLSSGTDWIPGQVNRGGSRRLLQTDNELAAEFAPVLRFDSRATSDYNGFPSTYHEGGLGRESQNMNPAVSGIPTYYKLYREDNSSDTSRVTSIAYYWSYEYQVSCMVDQVIPSEINSIPTEITDILGLGDINTFIGDSFGEDAGAHDGDIEKVFVNLDYVNNEYYSLRSVTFNQHNGKYTVTVDSGKLETDDTTSHPHVYVGRRSHGSYHNAVTDVGGCGYFHDYRDGDIVVNSWENLKDSSIYISEDFGADTYGGFGYDDIQFEDVNIGGVTVAMPVLVHIDDDFNDNYCSDAGCSWTSCENRAEMISNAELCTPLTCKDWSTGCLPWGVSDSVKGVASIQDMIFRLYSTGDPDCGCVSVPFVGDVCIGENIQGEVCYPNL